MIRRPLRLLAAMAALSACATAMSAKAPWPHMPTDAELAAFAR